MKNTVNFDILVKTALMRDDATFEKSVNEAVSDIGKLLYYDEKLYKINSYYSYNPRIVEDKEFTIQRREKLALNLAKRLRWLNTQCKLSTGESFINTFIPLDDVEMIVKIVEMIYCVTPVQYEAV
jgi:hypothetical protein